MGYPGCIETDTSRSRGAKSTLPPYQRLVTSPALYLVLVLKTPFTRELCLASRETNSVCLNTCEFAPAV